MFFPLNQDQNSLAAVQKNKITSKFGKSFLFDFDRGDFILFDGKIHVIEGKQALMVWIKKVLKTEKVKYKIYEIIDNNYGISLLQFISSDLPTGVIYAGIQSGITTMLMNHPDITAVNDFQFTRDKKTLTVNFTIYTTYGGINEVVSI